MGNKGTKEKKKAGVRDWIYRIIILILIVVICISGYKIISIQMEYHKGTKAYDDLADIAVSARAGSTSDSDQEPERLEIDWDKLIEQKGTRETINYWGWIRLRNTVINYPMIQGEDNERYLKHLLTGEYSSKGSIFIDSRNAEPFKDFNTFVYGHNMNDDSMFNCLLDYINDDNFYDKHKIIQIYTMEQDYDLYIFGAAKVSAYDELVYNIELNSGSPEAKAEYINWIVNNNQIRGYDDSVEVGAEDLIVSLSTCTNENIDDRVVVWGKLVPVTDDN